MRLRTALPQLLVVGVAVFLVTAARLPHGVLAVGPSTTPGTTTGDAHRPASLLSATDIALGALSRAVGPLSHPRALQDAFQAYYLFKASHPEVVRKPYLYFVDYGLPSTARRGYVFDMAALRIVDGPFTVAHGRGSAPTAQGVPTRFSNAIGSAATSLGLYIARATYGFHGTAGGQPYTAIGLALSGVSPGFNDNAAARRVVAHGAPYVTSTRAGQSEGCPAMEPWRAQQLLPKLADGGMVFLFAPDSTWLHGDPWVSASP